VTSFLAKLQRQISTHATTTASDYSHFTVEILHYLLSHLHESFWLLPVSSFHIHN
jgi:hypothetical protein